MVQCWHIRASCRLLIRCAQKGILTMDIRKATSADYDRIQQIYAYARGQMKKNGNPSQWGDSRPSEALLSEDIQKGRSYVLEQDGQICAVFAFIIGADPTYRVIEEGQWLNEEPYGVIHRIASDGSKRDVFRTCLAYCQSQISNVRIDTHKDNAIMRHLLDKNGFAKCGTIYVEDGSPRIAYQKIC